MKTLEYNQDAKAGFSASDCSVSGRTHLDLFSGIGGFALAAQRTGWKTIGFAETDEYASKVLRKHWPDVPNHGDVRNVRNIPADLITGGFPCQPYSSAGLRRGNDDDRALWPQMRRIIEEGKPAWVLAENVPELDRVALDDVLADLEALGYETGTLEIPACAVGGAPHLRRRLWILAHAEREGLSGRIWESPEPETSLAAAMGRTGFEDTGWPTWDCPPELPLLAYGVSEKLDEPQTIGLGNAIVPQIATVILAAMARTQNIPLSVKTERAVERQRGGGK